LALHFVVLVAQNKKKQFQFNSFSASVDLPSMRSEARTRADCVANLKQTFSVECTVDVNENLTAIDQLGLASALQLSCQF